MESVVIFLLTAMAHQHPFFQKYIQLNRPSIRKTKSARPRKIVTPQVVPSSSEESPAVSRVPPSGGLSRRSRKHAWLGVTKNIEIIRASG